MHLISFPNLISDLGTMSFLLGKSWSMIYMPHSYEEGCPVLPQMRQPGIPVLPLPGLLTGGTEDHFL